MSVILGYIRVPSHNNFQVAQRLAEQGRLAEHLT